MKFYYAPGTCAIGIHVLLEEIGEPYESQKLDFAAKQQSSEAYLFLNPKGKVPILQRKDGSLLTEFQAIAVWLARTFQRENLFPDDPESQARILEVMDYAVGTVHMQGFSRFMRPGVFTPNQSDYESVRERGLEIFNEGLSLIDRQLGHRAYAIGSLSIADMALFYLEFWAVERLVQPLPVNLAAHYQRMATRAAVQRVLQAHRYPS
jgi:glutathione S-transferase